MTDTIATPRLQPPLPPLADADAVGARHRAPAWPGRLALVIFIAFASTFLYFFIDDEAIPFVYAQNLIHGKGLVYNSFEGRVEGYSDFLHVWLATAVLAVTRALGVRKLDAFFIGKGISLFCGLMLVWLTDRAMRRWPMVRLEGRLAGLLFLALAGPLAVWSCSSLETVAFSFMLAVLLFALWIDESRWAMVIACVACTLAFLERIDGFIHVGIFMAAALIGAAPEQRRRLVRQVVVPAGLLFVGYHLWRRWYFGEWFSLPFVTKVLYKLKPTGVIVDKPAEQGYVFDFLQAVAWTPLGLLLVPSLLWRRDRRACLLFIATALIAAYVAFVGDWMFGSRFFVPLLPAMALLLAIGVSALTLRLPRVGRLAAAVVIVCSVGGAWRFERTYERSQDESAWWRHPTSDPLRYFTPFYSLYQIMAPNMGAADTIAFNQAGFLPFMLDADNIDDLGICSRFVANLPTSDVTFTGVGRYSPLTNRPSIRAAHAYLLYRDPKWLIARGDLVRHANDNHAPPFLLGYRYRYFQYDAEGDNVVYLRTDVPATAFQMEPRQFLENLTHVSSVRRAWVQGQSVSSQAFLGAFPYLYDGLGTIMFNGDYNIAVTFDTHDADAYEIHLDQLVASQPATVVIALQNSAGHATFADTIELTPGKPVSYHRAFDDKLHAMAFSLRVAGPTNQVTRLRLRDLRIQGQRAALASHVARSLRFPAIELTQDQTR
jgi:hypothetical protein